MTNDEAIELAERAIAPCKGITLKALQIVIEMAKAYNKACDDALNPQRVVCYECKHYDKKRRYCPLIDSSLDAGIAKDLKVACCEKWEAAK